MKINVCTQTSSHIFSIPYTSSHIFTYLYNYLESFLIVYTYSACCCKHSHISTKVRANPKNATRAHIFTRSPTLLGISLPLVARHACMIGGRACTRYPSYFVQVTSGRALANGFLGGMHAPKREPDPLADAENMKNCYFYFSFFCKFRCRINTGGVP